MDTTRAPLRLTNRTRARLLLAGVLAFASTLLQPAAARALSTQFVLSPTLSFSALGGNVTNYSGYPGNTVLSFDLDFDHPTGNLIPVTFGNFILPSIAVSGGAYSFIVPSTFTGTLDLGTGAINTNPVAATLRLTNGSQITNWNFSFGMTTGSQYAAPCGQFVGDTYTGSALNLNTGTGTLLGTACVPPAPATDRMLFAVKLQGTVPPIPVPEPGALLLLGSGLLGLAWAGRAGRISDTFPS